MTAVSFSINRGVEGFTPTDITIGTSAPGTGDFEFRYNTTDGNGAAVTKMNLVVALKAFTRMVEQGLIVNAPPL